MTLYVNDRNIYLLYFTWQTKILRNFLKNLGRNLESRISDKLPNIKRSRNSTVSDCLFDRTIHLLYSICKTKKIVYFVQK